MIGLYPFGVEWGGGDLCCDHINKKKSNRKKGNVMSNIQPQGENLRKAISWISEERIAKPDQSSVMLAEKAAIKFDLNLMILNFCSGLLKPLDKR